MTRIDAGRWLSAFGLGAAVAAAAWRRQALTADGGVAAAVVGGIAFGRGGVRAAIPLLVFFVTSSALSRLRRADKQRRGTLAQAKGAQRDAWQVLANGGAASALLLLRQPGGFVGSLAAAAADTWATELGMLAHRPPRSIVSLRPVPRGSSGGVTPEGTLAALGGALAVGGSWWVVGGARRSARAAITAAILSGMAGCALDSVLGATLQALYRCRACGELLETPHHPACDTSAELVRGWGAIDNDAVNALSTAFGGLVGAILDAWPKRLGIRSTIA